MTRTDRVEAVHVVVPAHDEEALLPGCLDALDRAVARVRRDPAAPPVQVTVVLDACTDRSAALAADRGVRTLAVDARCVGVARAAGVAHAADLSAGVDPDRVWVATTDADSVVPVDWLAGHLARAALGTELVLGRVHPHDDDLAAHVLARWWQLHRAPARPPVHGANLGFTLAAYARAGGFPPLREHEDVAFIEAALATGCRWSQDVPWVRTSGRTDGRSPGGFAGYLRSLAAEEEAAG